MAGLDEQALWETEIYQIEQTDPVVGGPPNLVQGQGITNVPHQALANRTAWLKAQVDGLVAAGYVTQADIDGAIRALVDGAPDTLDTLNEIATALADKLDASAYTAADVLSKLKTVDGADSGLDADLLGGLSSSIFARSACTISAGTGLTGGGNLSSNRTISAVIPSEAEAELGVNNTKLMTPLRTKQAITAAIDVLVDGAPEALDTLNELAAALGDDPNFAATVTAQIAAKLDATAYTAADVLAKLKSVDGAGSGLNADTIDGKQASSFWGPDNLSGYGAVGSFVFAARYGYAVTAGNTYAGSQLRPAGINSGVNINDNWFASGKETGLTVGAGSLSGTWRALGSNVIYSTTNHTRTTLFQRIA